MSPGRLLSVGSPPTFGQMVSRAVDGAADSISWVPSVTAAEELLVDEGPVDVIVVSPGVKEADALGFSEFVARSAPSTAVVLVRDHAPGSLITAAMRAGARDVVDLSRGNDDLRESVDRALAWSSNLRAPDARRSSPRRQGTMVAIFSSKGGSGKTFMATNLAVAVAKRWAVDTAIVDLDLDMGDVYSYYGLEPKLAVHDLLALGDRTDREGILSAGSPVIEHLWAYGAPADPAAEAPSGEAVGKLLRSIREQFAFSVVDATAEYSDQALAAFDLADTICLVAALDVVGVRHLAKALETLQLIGVPRDRIRVILNRADSQVGLSPQQVERIMHLKVDAMVPSSRMVPTALNRGIPVYLDEPRSEIAASIDALADLVAAPALGPAETEPAPPVKRRRWSFGRTPAAAAPEPVHLEPVHLELAHAELAHAELADAEPAVVTAAAKTHDDETRRAPKPRQRKAPARTTKGRPAAKATSNGRASTNGRAQARRRTVPAGGARG